MPNALDILSVSCSHPEWSGVLRAVRAGMFAVPSRVQQRLPHLATHDIVEIDAEVRGVCIFGTQGFDQPACGTAGVGMDTNVARFEFHGL